MGRIRLKLSKIVMPNDTILLTSQSNNETTIKINKEIDNVSILSSNKLKESCRICFNHDSDLNNPLISPCKCSGSIKYIHLKCLQESIMAGKYEVISNDDYKLIIYSKSMCEICKEEYPTIYKFKDRIYYLIDKGNNFTKYAIFDYFIYKDDDDIVLRTGILYVNLNLKDKSDNLIKIGRTKNNYIKLDREETVRMLMPGSR